MRKLPMFSVVVLVVCLLLDQGLRPNFMFQTNGNLSLTLSDLFDMNTFMLV